MQTLINKLKDWHQVKISNQILLNIAHWNPKHTPNYEKINITNYRANFEQKI